MAYLAGTFTSHVAIGNREDLSDVIYNISPTETPFMSMIAGREKATATYHEWQTDSLAAAAANAVVEGNDATFSTAAATTRVGNRTQISTKTVLISGTQQAVDKAGRDSEIAYQLAKRSAELKRDMEFILCQNTNSSAGGNTGPARVLGGLGSWYNTNTQGGTNFVAGGFSSGNTVAHTETTANGLISFTEARLKTAMQQAWSAGGSPDIVMLGAYAKQEASRFGGIATLYRDANGNKQGSILGAADVYVSDFGEVRIVPSRFSRARDVHVLDSSMWAVSYLRPFKQEPLAKTGDGEKRQLVVEYTLVSKNEAASALIADCRSS